MSVHQHLENGAFTPKYVRWRTRHNKWRFSEYVFNRFRLIAAHVGAKTVADLGAGAGVWVNAWREAGYDAIGYDATPGIEELSNGLVREADLSRNAGLFIGQPDLVQTIDVGEHVPPAGENTFIRNCCRATRAVIVGWGVPGQKGCGHVNCLATEVVREKFEACGMIYSSYFTDILGRMNRHYKGRFNVFLHPQTIGKLQPHETE